MGFSGLWGYCNYEAVYNRISEGDDLNAVFDAAFGFLEKEESSDDEEDEEGENWEPNSSTVSVGGYGQASDMTSLTLGWGGGSSLGGQIQ